nr:lazarillo protein-like [Onthophagus taurus]
MSINYTAYFLQALLVVSLIRDSIEIADERCHKIPLIKNFNIKRITGHWYGQEIGDLDGNESSKRCLHYFTTLDEQNSKTTVIGFRIFNGTSTIGNVEMFKAHQVNNSSEFLIEWMEGQAILSDWLIGTDYDTWSVYYICRPEQVDRGDMFIITRARNPSNTTLEIARNSVKKCGLKLPNSYFKRIDQSDCVY